MRRLLGLLAVVAGLLECGAIGQTGDLGAQIAAADAKLGSSPGQIIVSSSGTVSEGKVSLSAGHDLVCTGQTTIFLDAGSYLYQSSNTSIQNCIISSTSTPISGEVQSTNTNNVQLVGVTFVGGGNLVYWAGVSDFLISDNTVVSITAVIPETHSTQSGYYLVNCSRGWVNNLSASGFVFPPGPGSIPAVLALNLSQDITINNISINNLDASFAFGGSGIQINGSSHIYVNGGVITHNAKMDGITTESYAATASYDVTITGLNASYNGGQGLNTSAPLSLGDAIDIINTGHVRISNCTLLGSGYIRNEQPAIWLFLDEDVVVENSDLSDGSMGGLDIAGSQNVQLINNTINRNQASGTFAEQQAGTATSVGTTVTFVSGVSGGFGLPWIPGTAFILGGVTFKIASVTDSGHLVLQTAPPAHPTPVGWAVNSTNIQIIDDVIDDNGLARFGGAAQVGIDWADATTGVISGVTSVNTGIGAQLYGLEFDNTASAMLYNDNFSGNINGGNGINGAAQAVSPASVDFPNQRLATTSAAQTVTLTAGSVVLQNLVVQVDGDFSQTNNCGERLAAYATCQVHLTFTPPNAGAFSGTLTVTDGAPNSPQIVPLSGTGLSQGLGLSIATGSSGTAAVTAGSTAEYSLSIGGAGLSGTASVRCSGVPPGATCQVPTSEAISATQSTTFTVSVITPARTKSMLGPFHDRVSPWLWAFAVIGWIVILPGSSKLVRHRYRCSLLLVLLSFLCACGGGGGSDAARSYTLMVTANIGSTSQQVPLTLWVR